MRPHAVEVVRCLLSPRCHSGKHMNILQCLFRYEPFHIFDFRCIQINYFSSYENYSRIIMKVSTSYHPTVNKPYKFLSKGVIGTVLYVLFWHGLGVTMFKHACISDSILQLLFVISKWRFFHVNLEVKDMWLLPSFTNPTPYPLWSMCSVYLLCISTPSLCEACRDQCILFTLYRIQVLYTNTNETNQEADVSVILGHSPYGAERKTTKDIKNVDLM